MDAPSALSPARIAGGLERPAGPPTLATGQVDQGDGEKRH
jgi:hypothetical protein